MNEDTKTLYRVDYQNQQLFISEWSHPLTAAPGRDNLWGTTPNEAVDLFLALRRRQIATLEAEMIRVEALRQ